MDIIAGTFLIVGLTDDNFGDLPDELARKYANLFAVPSVSSDLATTSSSFLWPLTRTRVRSDSMTRNIV